MDEKITRGTSENSVLIHIKIKEFKNSNTFSLKNIYNQCQGRLEFDLVLTIEKMISHNVF